MYVLGRWSVLWGIFQTLASKLFIKSTDTLSWHSIAEICAVFMLCWAQMIIQIFLHQYSKTKTPLLTPRELSTDEQISSTKLISHSTMGIAVNLKMNVNLQRQQIWVLQLTWRCTWTSKGNKSIIYRSHILTMMRDVQISGLVTLRKPAVKGNHLWPATVLTSKSC